MRTLKLTVAYDGSAYHGFQKQPGLVTVQGVLEEVLCKLCGEEISTFGSGRTDANVHALGQIVTLKTNGRIPIRNIVRASASLLPADIVVINAEEMPDGFHARFSAKGKRYQYRLVVNEIDSPFLVKYAWQIREKVNIQNMNKAAEYLLGSHDFSAFRSSGSVDNDPVRTIYKAHWEEKGGEYLFAIEGDGFLYHMVRNIVWSLVQVGIGKRTPEDFLAELNSKRTEFLNEPAPPQGLYLDKVFY